MPSGALAAGMANGATAAPPGLRGCGTGTASGLMAPGAGSGFSGFSANGDDMALAALLQCSNVSLGHSRWAKL